MNDSIQLHDTQTPTAFKQFATRRTNGSPCGGKSCSRQVEYRQLLEMQRAFGRTGGLVSGDEAARLLRRQSEQPISKLARWIVSRRIVNFEWQSQTLVPLFQFDPVDTSLRASLADVVRELIDVFDDWELAVWFAQSNTWLGGAVPCELLGNNATAVLQAARADRFIARG